MISKFGPPGWSIVSSSLDKAAYRIKNQVIQSSMIIIWHFFYKTVKSINNYTNNRSHDNKSHVPARTAATVSTCPSFSLNVKPSQFYWNKVHCLPFMQYHSSTLQDVRAAQRHGEFNVSSPEATVTMAAKGQARPSRFARKNQLIDDSSSTVEAEWFGSNINRRLSLSSLLRPAARMIIMQSTERMATTVDPITIKM